MIRFALLATLFAAFVPACATTTAEDAAQSGDHLELAKKPESATTFRGSVVLGGETFRVSIIVTHPGGATAAQRSAFVSDAFVGCTVSNDPFPALVRLQVVSSADVVVADEVLTSAARSADVIYAESCEDWRTAPHAIPAAEAVIPGPIARFTINGIPYRLGGQGWPLPASVGVRGELHYAASAKGVFTKHEPAGGGIFEEFVVPAGEASLTLASRIPLAMSEDVVVVDETTPLPEVIRFEAIAQ